jgi:hypothetical protein
MEPKVPFNLEVAKQFLALFAILQGKNKLLPWKAMVYLYLMDRWSWEVNRETLFGGKFVIKNGFPVHKELFALLRAKKLPGFKITNFGIEVESQPGGEHLSEHSLLHLFRLYEDYRTMKKEDTVEFLKLHFTELDQDGELSYLKILRALKFNDSAIAEIYKGIEAQIQDS